MTIKVTKADIKKGKPASHTSCPVSLALKRAGIKRVYVSSISYCGYKGGLKIDRFLPSKAISFIDLFDRGVPVEPFSFRISINQ